MLKLLKLTKMANGDWLTIPSPPFLGYATEIKQQKTEFQTELARLLTVLI